MRRRGGSASPAIEEVAQVTQRLAVLLAAGVSPASAWAYLEPVGAVPVGEEAPSPATPGSRIIRVAAAAGRRGDSIAEAVATEAHVLGGQIGDAWLALASAWEVATQAGVLFGSLLGFNTLHTLFVTAPGWACLAGGAVLMFAADRWNRRLLHAARARDPTPGLELDLTAIAMTGGGSIDRARALVDTAADRYALHRADSAATIDRVLALAVRAGVPAAELLRSEADQLRRQARSDGQRRAATLGVTLMIPLGVCVLPAFMLIGVLPLLMTVLSSTVLNF